MTHEREPRSPLQACQRDVDTVQAVQKKGTPLRVLIVDDDPDARTLMRRVVETKRAFRVVGEAVDGLDALEQMESLKPQVVIMDVRMPKMDGVEATRRLKERWPDVAVVGFSAFGDQREEMLEAGASAYILKDVATDEVIALIETATSTPPRV